jgi:hypothetical protein
MRRLVVALCLLLCVPQLAMGQNDDDDAAQLVDIQRLIDANFPDIEIALIRGKLIPLAAVIMADNSMGAVEPGNASRGSGVAELKEALSIGALRGTYKAIAVFSDTLITQPGGGQVHAIAVHAEHTLDDFAYLFFYPYERKGKNIIFQESFGDTVAQEVYKP